MKGKLTGLIVDLDYEEKYNLKINDQKKTYNFY